LETAAFIVGGNGSSLAFLLWLGWIEVVLAQTWAVRVPVQDLSISVIKIAVIIGGHVDTFN